MTREVGREVAVMPTVSIRTAEKRKVTTRGRLYRWSRTITGWGKSWWIGFFDDWRGKGRFWIERTMWQEVRQGKPYLQSMCLDEDKYELVRTGTFDYYGNRNAWRRSLKIESRLFKSNNIVIALLYKPGSSAVTTKEGTNSENIVQICSHVKAWIALWFLSTRRSPNTSSR